MSLRKGLPISVNGILAPMGMPGTSKATVTPYAYALKAQKKEKPEGTNQKAFLIPMKRRNGGFL